MQITSINDIIQGELLNSPAISFIYNIKTKVKKVQEGDLFFAQNENDIQDAVNQGAFAIVIQNETKITDNEIAWIKVENIQKAIIKFIRYKFSKLELNAYCCDDISLQLLKIFTNQSFQNSNIWLYKDDLESILTNINDIKSGDTLVCNNKILLNNIYPVFYEFNTNEYSIKNLIEHSLFESTFSYKEHYFQKIRLSSMFINQFLEVATFLNFEIDINKLKKINYFKPIFIDKFLQVCEYGKSDKFILVQEKEKLAKKEIKFIFDKYKYAKIVVISREILHLDEITCINANNKEKILKELKKIPFNAAYIIGYSKNEIETLFEHNNITTSLL